LASELAGRRALPRPSQKGHDSPARNLTHRKAATTARRYRRSVGKAGGKSRWIDRRGIFDIYVGTGNPLFRIHVDSVGGGRSIGAAGARHAVRFDVRDCHLPDAAFERIGRFQTPAFAPTFSHKYTDAGLKELAGLVGLQRLDLEYTGVTNAGLKPLGMLRRCNYSAFLTRRCRTQG